jgi:hypothetical protein
MKGSWRRRCDAHAKHKEAHAAGKLRGLNPFCRKWAVPGKTRCYLHGGKSTVLPFLARRARAVCSAAFSDLDEWARRPHDTTP